MATPGMQHYHVVTNLLKPNVSKTIPENFPRKMRQSGPMIGAAAALALSGGVRIDQVQDPGVGYYTIEDTTFKKAYEKPGLLTGQFRSRTPNFWNSRSTCESRQPHTPFYVDSMKTRMHKVTMPPMPMRGTVGANTMSPMPNRMTQEQLSASPTVRDAVRRREEQVARVWDKVKTSYVQPGLNELRVAPRSASAPPQTNYPPSSVINMTTDHDRRMVFQLNQFQAGAQDGNGNDMEMQYSGMDDNHDGGYQQEY